jgi:molybdopterin synthase catalytic subunit
MTDKRWIEISPTPITAADAVAFVTDPAAGGIDVFLGTTRAEICADGVPLLALDYQAYDAMAIAQLNKIADEIETRWPVVKLAVLHRTGRVAIGEPSVVIAVSTPHRADSFQACRAMIDRLKEVATIWKQELWEGGDASWVHPGANHEMTNDQDPKPNQ